VRERHEPVELRGQREFRAARTVRGLEERAERLCPAGRDLLQEGGARASGRDADRPRGARAAAPGDVEARPRAPRRRRRSPRPSARTSAKSRWSSPAPGRSLTPSSSHGRSGAQSR
jgi:hypothetical protein